LKQLFYLKKSKFTHISELLLINLIEHTKLKFVSLKGSFGTINAGFGSDFFIG